ncbi:MAG: hypothetical protein ACT4OM_09595 [Actinomycetota bacterium]
MVTATGLAFLMVVLTAAAAFAHASFTSAPSNGFLPNTTGGTGAAGATPPYSPNTTVTAWIRNHEGPNDTPIVKHEVIFPEGWTEPSCGPNGNANMFKQKNDASTNFTNQPGDAVSGWTCTVDTSGPRARMIQQAADLNAAKAAALADMPWFFQFTVKTPSPAAQTSYNCTGGTEGFISIVTAQSTAFGPFVAYWIPTAGCTSDTDLFPGGPPTLNPGDEVVVAGGLTRTVSPTPAPPPATGSPANHKISATVVAEEFSITIGGDKNVVLTPAASSTHHAFTGALDPVTLRDTRSGGPAWTVSGQTSAFNPAISFDSGKYLGWTPSASGAGSVAGPAVAPEESGGLRSVKTMASAPAGHALGDATLGAALDLKFPLSVAAGTYTTTLTLTAI